VFLAGLNKLEKKFFTETEQWSGCAGVKARFVPRGISRVVTFVDLHMRGGLRIKKASVKFRTQAMQRYSRGPKDTRKRGEGREVSLAELLFISNACTES
jgi:hypothetical protein